MEVSKIHKPDVSTAGGEFLVNGIIKSLARILAVASLILALSSVTVLAQGPAGNGASVAAGGGSSSHSLNPMKLFGKKEAKPAPDANAPVANEELDKRLEAKLRQVQVLPEGVSLQQACVKFLQRVDCLAALHVSHNLALNFECVKSNVTGVRVGSDTSSCRMPDGDKPLSLAKTIKLLKPEANAKGAAKEAETAAKEELKQAGA